MNKNTYVITRGAMLLALALIFQSLRLLIPGVPPQVMQWLIGSLVNLALLLSAYYCGLWPALVIAAATPLMAFITGQLANAWFIPCVAAANAVLCVVFYVVKGRAVYKGLYQKGSAWFAVIAAAAAKFIAIYLLMAVWAIPALILDAKAAAALSGAFSIIQLFTALIGGILSILFIRLIPATTREVEAFPRRI